MQSVQELLNSIIHNNFSSNWDARMSFYVCFTINFNFIIWELFCLHWKNPWKERIREERERERKIEKENRRFKANAIFLWSSVGKEGKISIRTVVKRYWKENDLVHYAFFHCSNHICYGYIVDIHLKYACSSFSPFILI